MHATATSEDEDAKRARQRRAGQAALIVLVSLVAYAPVLTPGAGFLWDDDAELWGIRGDLVQRPDGPLRAWFPIELPESGALDVAHWRPVHGHGFWPLTPTVLWLEWRAFGADRAWARAETRAERRAAVEAIAYRFHWPGVLLHACNALLVMNLLRRLSLPGAFWVALLFAVHPIQVPSVAWVSELKNTLSLFFALLATRAWLAVLARGETRGLGPIVAALLCFFLSLAAKTAAVGLPVVWTLLALRHDGGLRRDRLLQLAPAYGLGLAMAFTTLWFTAASGGLSAEVDAPDGFWARLTQAGWVPWFYLGKTVWPFGLMMIYPAPALTFGTPLSFVPGLLLVGVGLAGVVGWRRGHPWPAIALGSIGVLLFPVAGFFDMTFMMHAPVSDHFAYMASVPTIALLVGGSVHAFERSRIRRQWRTLLLVAIALVALVLTHARAEIFRTQTSLWTHNVAANPRAWMAQYNLGSLLELEARSHAPGEERTRLLEAALGHLSEAALLQPVYPNASAREAAVLAALGRDEEAVTALERALAAGLASGRADTERHALIARDLARARVRLGQPEEAIQPYEQALVRLPSAWKLRLELADAYVLLGRDQAAESHLRRVLAARPRAFDALLRLAEIKLESDVPSVRDPVQAARLARAAEAAAGGRPERMARARDIRARARARAEASAGSADGPPGGE